MAATKTKKQYRVFCTACHFESVVELKSEASADLFDHAVATDHAVMCFKEEVAR